MKCNQEKWNIVCRECNEEIPKEFIEGDGENPVANITKTIAVILRRKSK